MKTQKTKEYYKSKRDYYGNIGISSFEKRFVISEHAMLRIKQRKVKMPIDYNKLKVIKGSEINSKVLNAKVNKYTMTFNKKKSVIYWTDGEFVFVTQSKKAAEYIIITVL